MANSKKKNSRKNVRNNSKRNTGNNTKKKTGNNSKNKKQNLDRKKTLLIIAAVAAGVLVLFLGISAIALNSRAMGAWQCGAEEPFYSVEYSCEITREILLEENGDYVEVVLDPQTEEVLALKNGTWKTGLLSVKLLEEGSESSATYWLNPFTGSLNNDGCAFSKD